MDFTLRCNSLKCRGQINERAVVTTCSHIFCVSCSDNLGLSNAAGGNRICPACETHLTNPDDAVVAQLNPSEDYKTSVLSGLSPGIIMECAGRGLAFYTYQTTQEIVYQEYLAKILTEKYTTLSTQMDKIIHDANSEIINLRNKLAAVQIDQDNLQQKNHELVEQVRDRTRKQQQAQQMYQALKKQAMESHAQLAASDTVAQTLQSATGKRQKFTNSDMPYSRYPIDHRAVEQMHSRQRSGSSDEAAEGLRAVDTTMRGLLSFGNGHAHGLHSSQGPRAETPQQRTRLPVAQNSNLPGVYMNGTGHTAFGQAGQSRAPPSVRRPLGDISPNARLNPGISGYGMSAGMKVGRQSAATLGSAFRR